MVGSGRARDGLGNSSHAVGSDGANVGSGVGDGLASGAVVSGSAEVGNSSEAGAAAVGTGGANEAVEDGGLAEVGLVRAFGAILGNGGVLSAISSLGANVTGDSINRIGDGGSGCAIVTSHAAAGGVVELVGLAVASRGAVGRRHGLGGAVVSGRAGSGGRLRNAVATGAVESSEARASDVD